MKIRTVGSLSSLIVAAALSTAAAETLPQATWEVVSGTVPSHWHSIVTPVGGGRALLTGIWNRQGFFAYLFDPARGVRQVADPPEPLDSHFGAPLDDGRALVGGGVSGRCFIYDAELDEWSRAAALPHFNNFYTNAAAALPGGRVIVTGGTIPDPYYVDPIDGWGIHFSSRRVFLFDPRGRTTGPDGTELTGSWEERAEMPATGTFTTHAPPIWETTVAVELGPDMRNKSVGRATHNVVVLRDGRVLVVGGRALEPAIYYGVTPVDAYDPGTDEWTRVAELPSIPEDGDGGYGGRGFPGVSLLESGEVLIFGGNATHWVEENDQGQVTFDIFWGDALRRSSLVLNPDTGQWRRVGDLNVGRMGPLVASWPPGVGTFVIAIGGEAYSDSSPPAEVFDGETWHVLQRKEPRPTYDDPLRHGLGLPDGTVLTWSSCNGRCTVKRLHPAGRPSGRAAGVGPVIPRRN